MAAIQTLHVANQVRGINGQGGLGDVSADLPKELLLQGIDARIITPLYGKHIPVNSKKIEALQIRVEESQISINVLKTSLPRFEHEKMEVTCYLLQSDSFDFERRDSPYNAILLCLSTIEFLRQIDFRVDLINCHDWHSGLIPVLINELYADDHYLGRIATVYTIHNIGYGYQGSFGGSYPTKLLGQAGLPKSLFVAGKTRSLEHHGCFNFAKGGVAFSDKVTTVSQKYASEIKTPAFGGGFEGLMVERSQWLCGILNGINNEEWNPAKDPNISPYNYSLKDSISDIQEKKRRIRKLLRDWNDQNGQKPFERLKDDSILIGFVGRICSQKLAIPMLVLKELCEIKSVQFVFLGSAQKEDVQGENYISIITDITRNTNSKVLFYEGYEEKLSHLIYGASEMFLVPSTFEPCGLTQMISMRYGTVPIVRFVGGLADSVIDGENGFGFRENSGANMVDISSASKLLLKTIINAVEVRETMQKLWQKLIRNGMSRKSSWSIPASQYMKVYDRAISLRVQTAFFGS